MDSSTIERDIRLVSESPLFDEQWYLEKYPDTQLIAIAPAKHFVLLGAKLGRDPGPNFNTMEYLRSHPDVAASGVNPLVHWVLNKATPATSGVQTSTLSRPEPYDRSVDVVVPVFNALEYVKVCLEAVRTRTDGYVLRTFIVNDGSDEETTSWLREFVREAGASFVLIEHETNRGYTTAVNTGLKATSGKYVVTLNSDTEVSNGWLTALVRCMESSPKIGIAGPLSNAATWQNVPYLHDEAKQFAVNDIPDGMNCDAFAALIASVSARSYPRLPFVNGFCFMIKREVIEACGYMDEIGFPIGYGEENDFCIRAADAGYELAIADDAYVYHAKSKSFGHSKRKELSKAGSIELKRKHGAERFAKLVELVRQTQALDEVRRRITKELREEEALDILPQPSDLKILFLLPVKGGGGGAHSVVQEVTGMRRLGVEARVGVRNEHLELLLASYADIPDVSDLFIGMNLKDIHLRVSRYDIVIATIYSSIVTLKRIKDANPGILTGYYVQDYEAMFFEEGSEQWEVARASYELVPEAVYFAKTDWIAKTVFENHGVKVNRVMASIDHSVYKPASKGGERKVEIAAMIRPATPRRGAERTMRTLSKLKDKYKDKIVVHIFGCESDSPEFAALKSDFPHQNHGILRRPEVASLLGKVDVFIDMSDYQAFGRTGLEAMACGAVSVVPLAGGGDEYAIDGVNSFVVDSFDEERVAEQVSVLVDRPDRLRRMQYAAIRTASRYSVHGAVASELELLAHKLAQHRADAPRIYKVAIHGLLPTRKDGQHGKSSHIRLLQPSKFPEMFARTDLKVIESGSWPQIDRAGSVLWIGHGAQFPKNENPRILLEEWKNAGGRIVYDSTCFGEMPSEWQQSGAALLELADVVVHPNSQVKIESPRARHVLSTLCPVLWRLGEPRLHTKGPHARKEGICQIGILGDPERPDDIETIESALRRVVIKLETRIQLEVVGTFEHGRASVGKRVGYPKLNDYPRLVDWLFSRVNWDIIIVPEGFASAGEDMIRVRLMEIGALGAAMLCPRKIGEAIPFLNEDNCRLYASTSQLESQIGELAAQPERRQKLEFNLRKAVSLTTEEDRYGEKLLEILGHNG